MPDKPSMTPADKRDELPLLFYDSGSRRFRLASLITFLRGQASAGRMSIRNVALLADDLSALASPSEQPTDGQGDDNAANAEIVALVRAEAKRVLGGNCTFADDDVRALAAALSPRNDIAVLAGIAEPLAHRASETRPSRNRGRRRKQWTE